MIEHILVRWRERAAADWLYEARLARLLSPTPLGNHADRSAARARRRLSRADFFLDLWTFRARRTSSGADT